MVIILKPKHEPKLLDALTKWLEERNLKITTVTGEQSTILGLIGDTSVVDIEMVKAMDIVEDVRRIQKPYKAASREFRPHDTVIDVMGRRVGAGFTVIAGPCSVESRGQICDTAAKVKHAGAGMLRGGAFKPRTSPYAFQGLGAEGIKYLLEAKAETGMPVVSEIMNVNHLKHFENIDVIQVGARNMQNFELLKELGGVNKPILLKRGLANTMEELLMSAEYIMAGGNPNIILCERGIRTFETYTRNTLDLSCIPLLKELSHLPVVVDPSHATGTAKLVKPMSMAAAAAGADGLIIEVHNDPANAKCDGAQSLTPEAFEDVVACVNKLLPAIGKAPVKTGGEA
jgi:3-deoxy-7-phosphoheptulonate synthase